MSTFQESQSTASYMMFQQGLYCYAQNGQTGKIDYGGIGNAGGAAGTDVAAVIQAAIDARPLINGVRVGKIFFKAQTYNLLRSLKVTGPVNSVLFIDGEGSGPFNPNLITRFKIADGANCSAIENFDATGRYLFLHNIMLDGNKANNTLGSGIYLNSQLRVGDWQLAGLFNVAIQNFAHDGITGDAVVSGLCGSNLNIGWNGRFGIWIDTLQGASLTGPIWLHDNVQTGLYVAAGNDVIIDGLYAENNGYYGEYLVNIQHSQINLWAAFSNYIGVVIDGCTDDIFNIYSRTSCQNLAGCPLSAYASQIFITNFCKHLLANISIDKFNTVAGLNGLAIHSLENSSIHVVADSDGYALSLPFHAGLTNNVMHGVLNGVLGAIDVPCVSSKIRFADVVGFVNESSGTAEASNTDTVAFGITFAGVPQSVTVTVNESDARYIAQAYNITTTGFDLYLYDETADTLEVVDKTISWKAEYNP